MSVINTMSTIVIDFTSLILMPSEKFSEIGENVLTSNPEFSYKGIQQARLVSKQSIRVNQIRKIT